MKKNGRPPKYATPKELGDAIALYFKKCERENLMPNKAGLCFALKITKETYNQYKTKLSDPSKELYPIQDAERFIENAWVQRLAMNAATGAIFYLKNAFSSDYRDRQEVEHSGDLPFSVTIVQADGGKKD